MKFFNLILFTAVIAVLWQLSSSLTQFRIVELENNGSIPYGPYPKHVPTNYHFNSDSTLLMSSYPVDRIKELSKDQFELIILNSLDIKDQKNLKPFLATILKTSEEYQLDPFWMLSIVMVESRFKVDVTSNKNAQGLMQIRPETALHLYQLKNRDYVITDNLNLYAVEENLELGAFYLKKLLQNFRMDFKNATIAYNLGPNRLKNLLSNEDYSTGNNSYYSLVFKNHQKFANQYKKELSLIPILNSNDALVGN
jgi:soluble lytic murein transglycosylase